jgi:1-acyl-sn-glycerol-3-phosphate acyltransferase
VTVTAERAVVPVAPAGRPSPLLVAACRGVGRAVARSPFSIRASGTEHVPRCGPVLLAGDHSGLLDGPLVYLLAPRPTAALAKTEIFVGGRPRLRRRLGVLPVHRGRADRAALRSGAPVVPVALSGTAAAVPRGTWKPRLRAPITLAYGRPLHVDVPGDPRARSTVRAAAEQLRLGLVAHLHESRGDRP